MNKNNVRAPKRSFEDELESEHELLLRLIQEHTALTEETFCLVREVRKYISLVSSLSESKDVRDTAHPWERPCPPFKM